jgi:hypothetical protein
VFPKKSDWKISVRDLIFDMQRFPKGGPMANNQTIDPELELEDEYEGEYEGEFEGEFEGEEEGEGESEEFLGAIARGIGGLLGGSSGQGEGEGEYEFESEWEGEDEGEEFFGRIKRGLSKVVRRAMPILKRVAGVALPLVGGAIAGPAGAAIGKAVGSAVREGEGEFEDEYEFEGEYEAPLTQNEAVAELMAAGAAVTPTDAEAEAMVGAATATVLTRADRAALRKVVPYLVRATSVLTRLLRKRRVTRPIVRTVPTIVRKTAQNLVKRAKAGQPVTRKTAARAMAAETKKILTNPKACTHALRSNIRATKMTAARRSGVTSRGRTVQG